MAILTQLGRVTLASALKAQPIFLAWGRGDKKWDQTPPKEDIQAQGLLDLIAYKKATDVTFCAPDANGLIEVPNGKFTVSNEATSHIYCRFKYDFEDGLGETIRELGIMVGTEVKSGVLQGKNYLSPSEIQSSGNLLLLENRPALFRDQGVKESFEFVLSF